MDSGQQHAPPVVSVMVVHRPGDWFDETLASLAAQDYPNLRSIFLLTPDTEEATTDLSERILATLPGAFVRELSSNPGFGAAVNEVLRLVEGDNGFFLICHDDIALDQRAVRTLVAEVFRSNAGLVGPKLTDWDQPRVLQHVGLGLDRFGEVDPVVEPGEVDQEQHDAIRDVFVLPSACVLVRADLFRSLDGFDPSISFYGEDIDLCWRAHHTGARVVVAPDARVRHRERLAERRPDIHHLTVQSRHRMRTVATLTGGSRLLGRSIQLALLTLVEVVVGLFTGRLGEALASSRALIGLIPRTTAILARRRAIRGQRVVPEREVLGLQVRGSSRLTSYLRGKETTMFVGADSTVRRWREASFGPPLAWFIVVAAVVIGSRDFLRNGVPAVGELLPVEGGPRELLSNYRSSFDARSFGASAPLPTGLAAFAILSAAAGFRMQLLMTMAVIGLVLAGALGAWRLATVFPSNRARVTAMIVYLGTPLVPGLLRQGDWSALVWFATVPWMVHLARRAAGIGTADPSADAIDLVDGVGEASLRERVRAIAFASLVLALAAAFVPVTAVLWLAAGGLVALGTVIAGSSWRVAMWIAIATIVPTIAAGALNLPWSLEWDWAQIAGPRLSGATGRSVFESATLQATDVRFSLLALGLYLPLLAALAICRAWRLTWAVRGASLTIGFGAILLLAERGELSFATPRLAVLAAPIALGLALTAAALAGGLEADVLARGFGWRQPLGALSGLAIVIGIVPGVLAIGDGAWHTPRTPLTTFLAAQLPRDPSIGDYRVLYLGDPRALPVPSREFRPGVAYAVIDAGPLTFEDRFFVPRTAGDDAVEEALELTATGSTLRVGKVLAPLGIRYIVLPVTDGVYSTEANPIAVPTGLIESLEAQLDIGQIPGAGLVVFRNESWMPAGAQLTGATADASRLAGADVLVRSDMSSAVPSMVGADGRAEGIHEVAPGVVHVATPFDDRLQLAVDGESIAGRPGFGVTTAFDVDAPGVGVLTYARDPSRSMWLATQLVLWLAVLAVAAGARASFSRRRGGLVHDETLIDLGDEPSVAPAIAGEVLGISPWGDDEDDLDFGFTQPTEPRRPDRADAVVDLGQAPPTDSHTQPSVARRKGVTIEIPASGRELVRDTTPPAGLPRVKRSAHDDQSADGAPDVDLAALVAEVDRAAGVEPDSGRPTEAGTDQIGGAQ